MLIQDIAAKLGCNRDTATKALKHWFESRGLEYLDGRERRTTLPRKTSDCTTDAVVSSETAATMPSSSQPGEGNEDTDAAAKPNDGQDLGLTGS
jgi:hypothetical protein